LPQYDPNRIQQCLSHAALQHDQDHHIIKVAHEILQKTEALKGRINILNQQLMTPRVPESQRRRVARELLQLMEDPSVSPLAAKIYGTVSEVAWFVNSKDQLVDLAKEPPLKPVTESRAPTATTTPSPAAIPAVPLQSVESLSAPIMATPQTPVTSASAATTVDNSQDQYLAEARQLMEAVEQFKKRSPEPNVRDVGANRLTEDPSINASWRNDARALLRQNGHDQQARMFLKYVWDIMESKAPLQEENNPNPLTIQFVDGVESLLSFCVLFSQTKTSQEQLSLGQVFLGGVFTLAPHAIPEISLPPTSNFSKKLDDASYGSAVKAQIEKLFHTHQNYMRGMAMACNLVLDSNLWRRWTMKNGISGAQGVPKVKSFGRIT